MLFPHEGNNLKTRWFSVLHHNNPSQAVGNHKLSVAVAGHLLLIQVNADPA